MSYDLFSDSAKDTALDAVGGTIMGSQEVELLKQIFVAAGNSGIAPDEVIPVANGGTGESSLEENAVLLGNGTSPVQTVSPSTNGNVLTSNGTTWTSSAEVYGRAAGMALSSVLKSSTVQLRLQTHLGDGVPIGLYKDAAATIPATADGDDVRAWKDVLSGSGLILTSPSAGPAAKLRFFNGIPCVEFNGSQIMGTTTAETWFPSKRGTIYAMTRNKLATNYIAGTFTAGGTPFMIQSFQFGTKNFYYDGSFRTAANYQYGTYNLAAVRTTNTNLAVYNSGTLVENITVGDSQPTANKLAIGGTWNGSSTNPGGLSGSLYYALIITVDGAINPIIPDLLGYLASYNVNIVCDGNSLTAGTSPVTSTQSYPAQLETLLRSSSRADCVANWGVGGQTTTQMTARAAALIDANWEGSPQKIVVAWEVTNELFGGSSAATAYANYVTYCQARRAAGATVIAVTVLPRSDAGTPGTFEASRQTVNTNIRANWATFADGLADVAASTLIGEAGDELNTTYYNADKVHLTATGNGVVAGIVYDAIVAL